MSGSNDWERVGQPGQTVAQDGQGAGDSGQGSGAAAGGEAGSGQPGQVSGESSDGVDQVVERVLERLGQQMGSWRQDLEDQVQRTVQSFSDRTAHRLSQQQRQRLQAVDHVMDGLQEMLGPDYDQVRRQKQLDILLDTEAGEDDGGQEPPEASPSPVAGQSGEFAQVYLAQKLGAPREWSLEEQAAIQRDLSQARDSVAWMAVVERYAVQRAGRGDGGQGSGDGSPGREQQRAARAQPVGGQAGGAGQLTPEQLRDEYNRAAADRNMAEMQRLGVLIDKLVKK